ncbi:MAG: TfoX/Sxy family protein [Chloroflexi bacterium]|nr:TfoX/Sxy family protein [Chloroflexota bacterium]
MAYDEALAQRVRVALAARDGITEQRMFGGLTFMDHGNMCAGVTHDELLIRVGKVGLAAALAEPGARPMVMRGRETGFVFVTPEVISGAAALDTWIARGLAVSSALPPKA